MITTSPEAALARLIETHPNREKSLRSLHALCLEQRARGSTDYSAPTLGPLLQARGGPGARAIVNPSGQVVPHPHCRAPERPAAGKAAKAVRRRRLLRCIANPRHRARISTLLADVNRLSAEVGREKARANALKSLADKSTQVTLGPATGTEPARYGRQALVLKPLEQDALRCVLDPDWRRKQGLDVDPRGRVIGTNGTMVLPVGFSLRSRRLLARWASSARDQYGGRLRGTRKSGEVGL